MTAGDNVPCDKHIALNKKKRRKTVALGATILITAAVIFFVVLFFAVKLAAGYVMDFLGPDEDAAYFNDYLDPVVMFDPSPFNDISHAKTQWKLETAIWAALYENEKSGSYAETADGREILPVKDAAVKLKKYFNITKPSYFTFSDSNFTYEYNRKGQCYYIPLTAVKSYYIPDVKKITRKFNLVTLTVNYKSMKNWGQNSGETAPSSPAEKTVQIVLKGRRGGYMVESIRNVKSIFHGG